MPALVGRRVGGTRFEQNDKLKDVSLIGLGRIEGPEDVILDRHDNLYAGSRHGDIVRFFAPDYEKMEIFAHIGGGPLGMAFDRDDNLDVCVGGMGLYRVTPRPQGREGDGRDQPQPGSRSSTTAGCGSPTISTSPPTAASSSPRRPCATRCTNGRSTGWKRAATAASSATIRTTNTTHTVLRGLRFPNGICVARDGQSILFAETWGCRVQRYWFDGPKNGPGRDGDREPAGLSRQHQPARPTATTGWPGRHALAGARPRAGACRASARRMAKRVPHDEWLFPNINTGCVLRFNEQGEILEPIGTWPASTIR